MFEVQNQPPPLEGYNLFTGDLVLREAVAREGADWGQGRLVREYSALVSAPGTLAAAGQPVIDAPAAAPTDIIERPVGPVATASAEPEPAPESTPQAAPDVPARPAPAPTPAAVASAVALHPSETGSATPARVRHRPQRECGATVPVPGRSDR